MKYSERKMKVCEEYLEKGCYNRHVAKYLWYYRDYCSFSYNDIVRYYKKSKGKNDVLGGYDLSFKIVVACAIISLALSMVLKGQYQTVSYCAMIYFLINISVLFYSIVFDIRGHEKEMSDKYYKFCVGIGRV